MEGAGQAVFARYLFVTTGLVNQWERGEKRPRGGFPETALSGRQERAPSGRVTDGSSPKDSFARRDILIEKR
jgi:hypothetical protein